jgi:sulfatase modifying factor 1
MRHGRSLRFVAAAGAVGLAMGAEGVVVIPTVPVGSPGNTPDSTGFGAVGYAYQIGTYEVTAGQYTEFLNAVAATDTFSLYNPTMASDAQGCKILRSGVAGSFSYSVAPDYANRPVNYVSWGDAARFANWMHNGQPAGPQGAGTTETGSYALNGVTDALLSTVSRGAGASWAIPTEDEWYKSAHFNHASGNYYLYATSSNTLPGKDLADPLGNNANYGPNPAVPIDNPYWLTVGGEFQNSASPSGTFDQNGNVAEWTEAKPVTGNQRYVRGGTWIGGTSFLSSATRTAVAAGGNSQDSNGFRLVLVPAPPAAALFTMGLLAAIRRRRVPRGG